MVGKYASTPCESRPRCNKDHLHKLCKTYFSHWKSSCSQWQCFVPWQCRWCVGSCCRYDRERSTGGRSLAEAACRAAGSRLLPGSRPGGKSVCSGAFHMATICYMSGRKKCLADDMGCCCVAVGRRRESHFTYGDKKQKASSTNCQLRGSYLVLSHAPFLSEVCAGWTLLVTVAVVKH